LKFIDLRAQYSLIKDRINMRTQNVLEHGQYIMGREVHELEQQLAQFVGVDHCIAVSSGTDALLISLLAAGVGRDDEVITTPLSFISVAEVLLLLGAKPVFVDIDPRTLNIDPNLVEDAVTKKTKALIPVNLYGQCSEFDELNSIARKYGILVIEDAAQSFGATYRDQRSGALADVGCTSFFPSKPLGCYGDGGACFTSDKDLASKMRSLRVHGQEERYKHSMVGLNGRLDTLQAAVLLEKLILFPNEILARERIGARYSDLLRDEILLELKPHNRSVYSQYTVRSKSRTAILQALEAENIPYAIHYPRPIHKQLLFKNSDIYEQTFPLAETAAKEVFSLPMHPYLSELDQNFIINVVNRAI
jgi:UDP-2-acetamido-2-deoxy-ribo-hexuluronate aminotransferase